MNFIDFFIRKPIFAIVGTAFFIIAGLISILNLPISKYPQIAPETISIQSFYTGANAEVVESAVTIPIEQEINGIEGIRYITSTSSDTGESYINVTLEPGKNPDLAILDIQNRIKNAEGRLPSVVNKTGVSIRKSSDAMLMVLGLYAKNGEYDYSFISNYTERYIREELQRIPGIAGVSIFGERKYAMRIWLNPQKMAASKVSVQDVENALLEQNILLPAGQIGQPPHNTPTEYQMTVKVPSRMSEPREFEEISIRRNTDGSLLRIKDIGKVELGAQDYRSRVHINGYPDMVGMLVRQLPNANAIELDTAVQEKLKEISKTFPPGLDYKIPFNPTKDVRDSINSVFITLIQAIFLVVLVIYIFLQNWRSTLIPTITIPVSLIGTFLFVKLFDFSINTLTLFGLTLATGLVVDDAIVVLENISRFIFQKKMNPKEASSKAMKEITGAVIATSLVLIAVFIPIAFLPGTVGNLYKQFALTIVFSIAISTIIALILAPSLSAHLVKEPKANNPIQRKMKGVFEKFNKFLSKVRGQYNKILIQCLRGQRPIIILFGIIIVSTGLLYKFLPASFVPAEDKGYFFITIETPSGTSVDITERVMEKAEHIVLNDKDINSVVGITGWSFSGSGSNKAILFPNLRDINKRHGFKHSVWAVIERLRPQLMSVEGARIFPFPPPTINGLGAFGGFQFELLVNNDQATLDDLANYTNQISMKANQSPKLKSVFGSFNTSNPQIIAEPLRDKIQALNINLRDLIGTIQVFLGSKYVNDFDFMNRIFRVYIQADDEFRRSPEDIKSFHVKSKDGKMISLNGLVKLTESSSPDNIKHYNLHRSSSINGSPAPGISSQQAINEMKEIASTILPSDFSYDWSGIAYEEEHNNNQGFIIFLLGILCVFLVLWAQYENLIDPFLIILVVPLAIFGGLLAQFGRGFANDVFCQLGLVMLIGLSTKNSILIVEYASQLREEGYTLLKSIIKACNIRFRPILMTSLSFILGILPLLFATGAGSASRQSLGTVVFGGMIFSTILSLLFIPIMYLIFHTQLEKWTNQEARE